MGGQEKNAGEVKEFLTRGLVLTASHGRSLVFILSCLAGPVACGLLSLMRKQTTKVREEGAKKEKEGLNCLSSARPRLNDTKM